MNKWIVLSALTLLAACDVPQAPVVTGPDGQTFIQINTSGLTCYNTKCLDINPAARSVRQIGNRRTQIPGNINVSDGTVTPDEFRQLGIAASLAGGEGSQSDRG
ncbi:hypothetical protein RUE5091_02968 [Ruegeria denitrificans]|uniref:Lipoprotein n=1 Tax=Ruegeria denitrificans TaxID=1715692 RepID=A0A0P1IDX3_9RHOB|nr:hypothetical protein [Ruegeria denitrificans]CUK07602.1 hypothetical protein RUE5091_02968 [Ruegeria denitrificans]